MILHMGQGEPLMTEGRRLSVRVCTYTDTHTKRYYRERNLFMAHGTGALSRLRPGGPVRGWSPAQRQLSRHEMCIASNTFLNVQMCTRANKQHGCNLSPVKLKHNCFSWMPPVTAKGKSRDLWAFPWPM